MIRRWLRRARIDVDNAGHGDRVSDKQRFPLLERGQTGRQVSQAYPRYGAQRPPFRYRPDAVLGNADLCFESWQAA
jgi:hypothetical protein